MSCNSDNDLDDLLEKSIDEKYSKNIEKPAPTCPFNINSKGKQRMANKVHRNISKVEEKVKFNPLLLPEGWVRLFHESGMFFYCHVLTRVVTWSMPYQLQTEPPRYHRVPVRSIPCLSFKFTKNNIDNLDSLKEEPLAQPEPLIDNQETSTDNIEDAMANTNTELIESKSKDPIEEFVETKQEEKDIEDGEIESSDEDGELMAGSNDKVELVLPKQYQINHVNFKHNRVKLNSANEITRDHSPPVKRRKVVSTTCDSVPDKCPTAQPSDEPTENADPIQLESPDVSAKLLEPAQLRSYCNKMFTFIEESKYVPRFFFTKKRPAKPETKPPNQSPVKPSEAPTQAVAIANNNAEKMVSIHCTERLKIPNKNIFIDLAGRNFSCILNMYCQSSFGVTPTFQSSSSLSGIHDFEMSCDIGGMAYAVGEGRTKKIAKHKAVMKTLEILIPGFFNRITVASDKTMPVITDCNNAPPSSSSQVSQSVSTAADHVDGEIYAIFDNMDITDPRVLSYTTKLNTMTPYNILVECMNRHCVLDSHLVSNIVKQNRHNVYKLKLGDKEVQANCENKREGRQLASQYMLAKLHPHIQRWGGILRLYGPDSKPVKRFDMHEMQNLLLEDRGGVKSNLINLLRKKMLELNEEWQNTNKSFAKFKTPFDNIPIIVFHPDSKEQSK